MKRKSVLIAALWLLAASTVLAQPTIKDLEDTLSRNPSDVAALVQLGKLYHDRAAAGDNDAVEKGFTYLDRALELDSSNAVALAYRGSLWTMRARDAWWPFNKLSKVDRGVDEMDKAVDRAPENITVRLVRAINGVQLPEMFHRLPVALKDFDHLLKTPEFGRLTPQLRCTIYCWAGIANKKDHQPARAKEYLQRAVDLGAGTPLGTRAQVELKDLP